MKKTKKNQYIIKVKVDCVGKQVILWLIVVYITKTRQKDVAYTEHLSPTVFGIILQQLRYALGFLRSV